MTPSTNKIDRETDTTQNTATVIPTTHIDYGCQIVISIQIVVLMRSYAVPFPKIKNAPLGAIF
jgi:hypothetical protein